MTDKSSDILIVGAGLAGFTAAVRASEQGAKVLLIDKSHGELGDGNVLMASGSLRAGGKTLPSPSSPRLLSISKTLAPVSAARTAAVNPAIPAPTTRTSHEISFMIFPSVSWNVLNDLNCLDGFRPRKLRNLVTQFLGDFRRQTVISHFIEDNLAIGETALCL